MFFINKYRVGNRKLIIKLVGNYKPYLSKEDRRFENRSIPPGFIESIHQEYLEDNDDQLDHFFDRKKDGSFREVLITLQRKPLNLNGHKEEVARRIKNSIPPGVSVQVEVLELQQYLGQHFVKQMRASVDVAQSLA